MRLLTPPVVALVIYAFAPSRPVLAAEDADTTVKPAAEPAPADPRGLPNWLTLGVQLRGRMEAPEGVGFKTGNDQLYYLNRIRLDLTIKPVAWFRIFVEGEDTHTFAYSNPPGSMQDPVDLRQAYVQVGDGERNGFTVRVGRQELIYASHWLFSTADWSITGRVFDAAVCSWRHSGIKLDLLTASVIQPDPQRFDRHKPGDRIFGAYAWLDKLIPNASIEPFLFYKSLLNVVAESGLRGDEGLFNGGGRVVGRLPGRLDYSSLIVRQWGAYAADGISALGGAHSIGWTINGSTLKPRISAEYDHASGDRGADGHHGTFDQLYGAYHYYLGAADRLGWRNSRNRRLGFDFAPVKKAKLFIDGHDLSLDSVRDARYDGSGARSVFNPKATSAHVGIEFDAYTVCQVTKSATIGAGIGHLIPGAYLRESTKGGSYTFPYLMVTKSF